MAPDLVVYAWDIARGIRIDEDFAAAGYERIERTSTAGDAPAPSAPAPRFRRIPTGEPG